MKVRLIAFAWLLAAGLQAQTQPAQEPFAPVKTGGFLNGAGWMNLNENEKLVWLTAFRDGVATALMQHSGAIDLRRIYPDLLLWGEARNAVDRFYQSPENWAIIVGDALRFTALRLAGAEPSIVDAGILEARQIANDAQAADKKKGQVK